MPPAGTLPVGDGEHHVRDDEQRHGENEERKGYPAEEGQFVQDVVDDRRGIVAGVEQVAAERTTRQRGGRWVRGRGRVHGPPPGRETKASLENTPIRADVGQMSSGGRQCRPGSSPAAEIAGDVLSL